MKVPVCWFIQVLVARVPVKSVAAILVSPSSTSRVASHLTQTSHVWSLSAASPCSTTGNSSLYSVPSGRTSRQPRATQSLHPPLLKRLTVAASIIVGGLFDSSNESTWWNFCMLARSWNVYSRGAGTEEYMGCYFVVVAVVVVIQWCSSYFVVDVDWTIIYSR